MKRIAITLSILAISMISCNTSTRSNLEKNKDTYILCQDLNDRLDEFKIYPSLLMIEYGDEGIYFKDKKSFFSYIERMNIINVDFENSTYEISENEALKKIFKKNKKNIEIYLQD